MFRSCSSVHCFMLSILSFCNGLCANLPNSSRKNLEQDTCASKPATTIMSWYSYIRYIACLILISNSGSYVVKGMYATCISVLPKPVPCHGTLQFVSVVVVKLGTFKLHSQPSRITISSEYLCVIRINISVCTRTNAKHVSVLDFADRQFELAICLICST